MHHMLPIVFLGVGGLALALARSGSARAPGKRPVKVYLVGAGPGAMDLITVRGQNVLQQADVVLTDRLVHPEQLAILCKPGCLIVNVGKDSSKDRYSQRDLEHELVTHATLAGEGKVVVRFKGGDPFVFGLGGSEIEALERHGIDWEYVPGLSSAMTLPGLVLAAPLTHKGSSNGFVVLSGHKVVDSPEWDQLPVVPVPSTTLVVLMCAKNLEVISQFLTTHKQWSHDLPCAVVQNGTTTGERVVRAKLGNIAQECALQDCTRAPLTLVVGLVVDLFQSKTVATTTTTGEVWGESRLPVVNKEEDEWWVFGYGSLVWKPDLPFEQEFDGSITGFVRRFYQTSPDHRGTQELPGRVVTLVESEHDHSVVFGKVYLVDRASRLATQAKLRHREKAGYEERVVQVTTPSGRVISASVFWAPDSNPHYSHAPAEQIAREIATRQGPSGPNLEYFDRLWQAMHEMQQRYGGLHPQHALVVDEHLVEVKRHLT